MRTLSILIAAIAVLSVSSAITATQAATRAGVTNTPPRLSTTGTAHRSSTAKKHGANAYGFCPPGQAKKPGRGSAFRC
jgi:acetylornithine deacetylase/succinyl-diaminopimelate desuccinylase-like protein